MIDLYEAIYEEDLETLKLILKDFPDRLNEMDYRGYTHLHEAISSNDIKIGSIT